MNKLMMLVFYGIFIAAFFIGLFIGMFRGIDKTISLCNNLDTQDTNITQKLDLGYDLDTNKALWKYPNETIWRNST